MENIYIYKYQINVISDICYVSMHIKSCTNKYMNPFFLKSNRLDFETALLLLTDRTTLTVSLQNLHS